MVLITVANTNLSFISFDAVVTFSEHNTLVKVGEGYLKNAKNMMYDLMTKWIKILINPRFRRRLDVEELDQKNNT
jgi:hypothetical protein